MKENKVDKLESISIHQEEYKKGGLNVPNGEYIMVGRNKFLISRDNISCFKINRIRGLYIFVPLLNYFDFKSFEKDINQYKFIKAISGTINYESFINSFVDNLVYIIPLKVNFKINKEFILKLIASYPNIKIFSNVDELILCDKKIKCLDEYNGDIYSKNVPSSLFNAYKMYNSNQIFNDIDD